MRFDGESALDDASLDVAGGEVVTVLGPSGSGKTTLLRVDRRPSATRRGASPARRRRISRTSHRTGVGSASSSRTTRSSRTATSSATSRSDSGCAATRREAIEARTAELLELVGLVGLERRPVGTLSGGEQQRVALARALAPEPRVLLLDEPLGSLDRRLRDRLLDDLGRIFDELGSTAIYVTHDQTEAFTLGDRVAVMRAGRVVQVATPDELWAHPHDADTARFLGLANVEGVEVIRPEAVSVRRAEGERQRRGRASHPDRSTCPARRSPRRRASARGRCRDGRSPGSG